MKWMLYGATGYTGGKIARQAVAMGMRPVLAGRGDNVRALAEELGLPVQVFRLDDAGAVDAALAGMVLVLHCAGPFSATAAPMMDACLRAGVHYLDITGEIPVFEDAHRRHAQAIARGILLCPGVGFDVVPTDCVAAALKAALPDATELALGFDTSSPPSPGTMKTMLESLPPGGKVRRGGRIVTVPLGHGRRQIDFGRGERTAVAIPWGDVATAYYSTGIPDIACYVPLPWPAAIAMRCLSWCRGVMGWQPLQRFLAAWIDRRAAGPDEYRLGKMPSWVWGEARNARGEVRTARIAVANGYVLTVASAIAVARHILESHAGALPSGYVTPSQLCGAQLIERLPGSGEMQITMPAEKSWTA